LTGIRGVLLLSVSEMLPEGGLILVDAVA